MQKLRQLATRLLPTVGLAVFLAIEAASRLRP